MTTLPADGAPPLHDAPPLSWPQEVLRLAERMRPGTILDPRCTVHRAFTFPVEPDLPLLGRVLTEVVVRHDALRTIPLPDGADLRLVRQRPRPVEVVVQELPPGATDGQVLDAVGAAANAPHDLDTGPLLRATWLRTDSGGVLVLSIQHWAGDVGSLDALTREIAQLYVAFRHDGPPPPDPPRYSDLARRQRTGQAQDAQAATVAWWRAELAGARRAALPIADTESRSTGETALVSVRLRHDTHDALVHLAAEHRASPYMVLLAALGALLDRGRPTGQGSDLTVFAVDGARTRESRRVIGFLAEPVPLRLRLDRGAPFGEAVARARETVLGVLSHRDVAFLRLLEAAPRLAVALLGGRRPATLVQYLTLRALDLDGLTGAPLPTFQPAVNGEPHPAALPIDLDVAVERCGDGHNAAVFYDPGLWSRGEIEAALHALECVLRHAAADPARSLDQLAAGCRP